MHVLQRQMQAVCMGRVGTGGMVMGMAVTPACRRCCQFCITFLFLWVGMLAMRGSNKSQDRTGHGKKKVHSHIERGRQCVGWYGIGDRGDTEQHNQLGPRKKCKAVQDARVLRQVWVRGKKMLVTCSNLVKGVRDWSGHQKKRGEGALTWKGDWEGQQRGKRWGQRSSERDWLGHKKKVSLHGTLARSRGQDRTDLDTKKKKPGEGGGIWEWSG